MTTFILLCLGGFQASTIPLIVTLIISGTAVITAFGIIMYSLNFWFGSIESVSNRFLDSLFVFALYPTNIYSGILQLMMFTVIPAGLIGYLPVELLRSFSWLKLGILLSSSLTFFALAYLVFYAGLKKYESGNQFGSRI